MDQNEEARRAAYNVAREVTGDDDEAGEIADSLVYPPPSEPTRAEALAAYNAAFDAFDVADAMWKRAEVWEEVLHWRAERYRTNEIVLQKWAVLKVIRDREWAAALDEQV